MLGQVKTCLESKALLPLSPVIFPALLSLRNGYADTDFAFNDFSRQSIKCYTPYVIAILTLLNLYSHSGLLIFLVST